MADGLHILPRYRENVEAILRRQLPGVEVRAYGSRVDGTSYDGSDLDLVLRAPGLAKIPYSQLRGLRYALRESTIPIIVDGRWATMPESYQREIERLYVAGTWERVGPPTSRASLQQVQSMTVSCNERPTCFLAFPGRSTEDPSDLLSPDFDARQHHSTHRRRP